MATVDVDIERSERCASSCAADGRNVRDMEATQPPPPPGPAPMPPAYPVTFSADYPDRPLDRVSTAFRIFTVIPIAIVLGSIGGYTGSWDADGPTRRRSRSAAPDCCSCRRC